MRKAVANALAFMQTFGPPAGGPVPGEELMIRVAASIALALVLAASPAVAKDKAAKTYVVVNADVGVPVFPYDLTDRPYEVVGEVKAGVRKASVFSKEASQKKIYEELWERAEKLHADAVVNAKYGDSHVSALSWGKTNATGTAVRFKSSGTLPAAAQPPR
ncbi:heavy metal-binding domain-containing protein [Sphingomonas sp. R86521]|uniref:heavy metal-binding domain-containing protein n=1 Tax=Sphingomonas sp. R86521 TaxID=3093860 RepID=UPI0036D35065